MKAKVAVPIAIALGIFCVLYIQSEKSVYSPRMKHVPSFGESSDVEIPQDNDIDKLYPWMVRRNYLPNFFTRPLTKSPSEGLTPDMVYANSTLVFVHLLKAGGGTTKTCLGRTLRDIGETPSVLIGNPNAREFYTQMLINGKNQTLAKSYVGDSTFSVCDFTAKPCAAFTVVRDPYERAISSYNMCLYSNQAQCRMRDIHRMTVNEWAIHQGSMFFRQLLQNPNFFTKDFVQLLDEIRCPEDPPASRIPPWWTNRLILEYVIQEKHKDMVLDYVLENLESWFAVIGLTTEYDTNFQLFERVFKLPFTRLCSGSWAHNFHYTGEDVNTTKEEIAKKLKNELSSDPAVKEALRFDLEIYRKAIDIFRRQKRLLNKQL